METPKFIHTKNHTVWFADGEYHNIGINIRMCTAIEKVKWVPQSKNRYRILTPCIKFYPFEYYWVFKTEEERDAEYEKITRNRKKEK